MRTTRGILLVIAVTCVLALAAGCGDSGGGANDGGTDSGTDTDADTDSDADADGGPDGGDDCSPDVACPIRVVGEGGDDCNSGSSWEDGLATVERGLDLAEPLGCEIWVKAGTYYPTEDVDGSSTPDDPRTVTFRLRAGVALYGGFAGNEITVEERDFVANEAVLSGDIGDVGDSSDNSYHVVTGADEATIDGLTITDGNADGDYEQACASGGGMYNATSSPTVTNCRFVGNTSNEGGGMYNSNSSPTVTNCRFVGNTGYEGGGMYNRDSSPTVTNCIFAVNVAPNVAMGDTGYGGGMANVGSSPSIDNCVFFENGAARHGGGMFIYESSPIVTNCTFSNNSSSAISISSGSPITLTNCVFWGDEVEIELGYTSSPPTVTYSDIQGGYEGEGNIDADPLFVDAEGGDLHLQSTSPCIDTGSNDAVPDGGVTDLDGNPRIVDGNGDDVTTVDMGAYEFQP